MTEVSVARLEAQMVAMGKRMEDMQELLERFMEQNRQAHKFFYERIEEQGRALEVQGNELKAHSERLERHSEKIQKHELAYAVCGDNVKLLKEHIKSDVGVETWIDKKSRAIVVGIMLFCGGVLARIVSEHIMRALFR